jgi:predicted dehydrogenase
MQTVRVIVVGLGVQGRKRRRIAGESCVATVDPAVAEADYSDIRDVPLSEFDAALLCTPDINKFELIKYLVAHKKHVLVEKPLLFSELEQFNEIERSARENQTLVYTAYNHRFEPSIVRAREILNEGILGKVYRCDLYYGNGTAMLVRDSSWRDTGAGVIPDLGSHLLDMVLYWFNRPLSDLSLVSANCYENRAPDHAEFQGEKTLPHLHCEISLLSWRNSFAAHILGEDGSLHLRSLCKWSESEVVLRRRVRPSGIPLEEKWTEPEGDLTWAREFEYFVTSCESPVTSLRRDMEITRGLLQLTKKSQSRNG